MSVMDGDGVRVVAHRMQSGREVRCEYAGEEIHRWKGLAALSLRMRGWHLAEIALVLGHHKGHISRMIHETRLALMGIEPDEPIVMLRRHPLDTDDEED